MATHSGILVWRIPWREEPGRLQSMESQRVGHSWVSRQQQQQTVKWTLEMGTCVVLIASSSNPFLHWEIAAVEGLTSMAGTWLWSAWDTPGSLMLKPRHGQNRRPRHPSNGLLGSRQTVTKDLCATASVAALLTKGRFRKNLNIFQSIFN